jgi:hypothetical protein
MPQSVGWQLIGHIVRTTLDGCSVTGGSGQAPDRCYRKSGTQRTLALRSACAADDDSARAGASGF